MRWNRHPYLLSFLLLLGASGVVWCATVIDTFTRPSTTPQWGVTFSAQYATYLGSDPHAVLTALLDNLHIKHFRLLIPWDVAEGTRGQFTFADITWQLDAVHARGGDVILAIGRKTPRWPECHDPAWLSTLANNEQNTATLQLIRATVEQLRSHPAIRAWQVENEPSLLFFGGCAQKNVSLLRTEVALVRTLDPTRPVYTTESGELSTGIFTAPFVDSVGLSLYRQTWNVLLGKFVYPLPPAYYARRAAFIQTLFGTPVFLSEVQAEPWAGAPLIHAPIPDQLALMNAQKIHDAAAFAAATHLSPIYLWGAEWWYWMKEKGHPEIWEAARKIFQNGR